MTGYYLRQMVQSATRHKMVHLLILCCLCISLTFLTIIFSTFQAGMSSAEEKAEQVNGNVKYVQFQRAMSYEHYLLLARNWERDKLVVLSSSIAEKKQIVSVGERMDNVTMVGIQPSYPAIFWNDKKQVISKNTVILSSVMADQLFGSSTSATGQSISVGRHKLKIAAVHEDSKLRMYVHADFFHQVIPDEALSGVAVIPAGDKAKTTLITTLKPYQPMISDWSAGQQSLMDKFRLFFIISAGMGVLLFVFALLSYAYMYTYKMISEQFKWRMFYIHGAKKIHMLGYIFTEMLVFVMLSSLIAAGLLQLFKGSEWVKQTNIGFHFELSVLVQLLTIMTIVLSIFIVIIYRLLQRRIYPREG